VGFKPDFAEAHYNLANVRKALGQLDEAITHYQIAIDIKPLYVRAHCSLAIANERLNQLDAAKQCIDEALKISPTDPDSQVVQGVLHRRQGNIKTAIETLNRVRPDGLSGYMATMRCFELGYLWDQEHASEKAFAAFHAGNRLSADSAALPATRKNSFLLKIERIDDALTSEWTQSWRPSPSFSKAASPIFLLGFPRSGTTLLDQILGSHPRLQVMEEKSAFMAVEQTIQSMAGGYPQAISALSDADVQKLRAQYFDSVDRYIARIPGRKLVDKHPLNTEYVPLIMRLFPEAQFILALRHPCDVVLSNFMQNYRLNDAMVNFLSLDDTVLLYKRVWGVWLKSINLLPIQFHTLKYESLVSNLEGEARDLFEFLGIDWNDSILDFHNFAQKKKFINTPSYGQVIEPVHERAKYRWKRYEEQLAPYLDDLIPFITEFKYIA